jgi:hypothetical protein
MVVRWRQSVLAESALWQYGISSIEVGNLLNYVPERR